MGQSGPGAAPIGQNMPGLEAVTAFLVQGDIQALGSLLFDVPATEHSVDLPLLEGSI